MKIVIVGPGAIGCLFGGLLARAGEEVVLLDHRPERADSIQQHGLRLITAEGEYIAAVTATTQAAEIGIVDAVLICVKAYDTESAIQHAAPCIGADTAIVTLQNGLGNVEKLVAVFGEERVIGGVTSHGAILLEAGVVQHTGIGDTSIGAAASLRKAQPSEAAQARLQRLEHAFATAGIPTTITDNLAGAIWGKVVLNCAINPLAALTRLRNGQLIEEPELASLLGQVATEAANVAATLDITLPYPNPAAQVKMACERTAENINSMLADVMKGRKTEINEINGAVVRSAEKLNIDAQWNKMLYILVQGVHRSS